MKINKKSFPKWVDVDSADVLNRLKGTKGLETNYQHDIDSNSNGLMYRMEFNYGTLKWDCIDVFQNGFKIT
jgi:hypothetical protein